MNRTKIIIFLAAALLVGFFFFSGLGSYLTLASLKEHRNALVAFAETHRAAVACGYIVGYILQSALALPGAAIFSLTGGALFGPALGTVYVNIGATMGATASFLLSRYLFRDAVRARFGPRLEPINRELEASGFHYLLFVRLVPLFPFFLINVGAGLTGLRLRTFVLTTMVGIIPTSIVFCNAGAGIARINSMRDVASPRLLASFALLGAFSLLPVLVRKFRNKRRIPS